MTPETETALSSAGRNFRNGSDAKITHASKTLKNQVQETGSDKAAGEVVQKGAVTKDVLGEANASTAQHTHHLSETLI